MPARYRQSSHKQQGVALVVVLLVVALVAIIATDLMSRLQRETRRSANMFDQQQAQFYALGSEKFAITVLQQSIKDSPYRDDLAQPWATEGLYFPVEGGDLTGGIIDANRCFNLNSLVSAHGGIGYVANKKSMAYRSYQRLLQLLDLPIDLADTLVDWLDSDEQATSADGAEDLEYALLAPPYRSANRLIADVSELRLVQGYSGQVVNVLRPYVCALPEAGYLKININTIDSDKPELLAMFIKDLPLETAAAILAERAHSGYDDIASFWRLDAWNKVAIEASVKSVLQGDSDYYVLRSRARIGRAQKGLTTLFKQVNEEKVQIIWRRFGAIE